MVNNFLDHGYRVVAVDEDADVFLINTCTVTGRSDSKCRKTIRHILKKNPTTTVIVAGCYSQVAAHELARIPGVDYILGTEDKLHLFDWFIHPGKLPSPKILITPVDQLQKAVSHPGEFLDHTRAFLKIHDGCDRRCSYCIVPLARGASRSVSRNEICKQAERFNRSGFKEIVLTGVHIGKWGQDLSKQESLADLINILCQMEGGGRIRLSSLDPKDITAPLLERIANSGKVCRHFHISLQSGSDTILRAMKRGYSVKTFQDKLDKIKGLFKNVGLGTDIIVGFPGETDAHFEETLHFLEAQPFTYLHIFPFSARPGTEAASMKNQVPGKIRNERAKILRKLGEKKRKLFMNIWKGESVDVLLENRDIRGWMGGFTSEYLRAEVPYEQILSNRLVRVHVERLNPACVRGRVTGS